MTRRRLVLAALALVALAAAGAAAFDIPQRLFAPRPQPIIIVAPTGSEKV